MIYFAHLILLFVDLIIGLCDSGDKCDEYGNCSNALSFKSKTEVCRESKANIGQLCDAPEYCTGKDHVCPEDKNYGDAGVLGAEEGAHVCRSSGRCGYGNCVDDVEEVCPGGTSECPPDIIFQREFDIIAAQQHKAGSTTVTITDLDDTTDLDQSYVQVCVQITLAVDWELLTGSEYPIKYDIKTGDEVPKSSPGSYANKYMTLEDQAGKQCFTIDTRADSCNMYFAFHLDVKKVGDGGETNTGETAWARLAADDEITEADTSLREYQFIKKPTKNGPPVKMVELGWGGYFSLSICCATVDVAATCPVSGGGGGGDTGTGTNVTSTTYTCAGDDEAATTLTCQHNATEEEAVGCHNLFGQISVLHSCSLEETKVGRIHCRLERH